MLTEVHDKQTEDLFTTPVLQQTAFWSTVKKRLGAYTLALDYKVGLGNTGCPIESDVLVVIQQVDQDRSIGYVPYGPELEPEPEQQGAFLEELSECIRPYLPRGCTMLRYDLPWESYWAHDDNAFDQRGWWMGPPETTLQELRFNYSTVSGNFRKADTNILPSNTVFLDLQKGTDVLLASMKPKTRYNINLASRKGVVVREAGIEQIDTWYQLYRDTAVRNGLHLHELEHFEAIFTARARSMRSPAEVSLLIAEAEGVPLAAMFLVISQHRAYYLYGASSSGNRNLMAPYALQWHAICRAREQGCSEYDMFGVSPNPDPGHPMYGLHRFKTGFGGDIYRRLGCWDYPLENSR